MEHTSSTSAHAGERPPAPAPFGPLPVLVYDHGLDPRAGGRRDHAADSPVEPNHRRERRAASHGAAAPANWKCYLSDDPTAASCVVLVLAMSEPSLLYCHVGATAGGGWVAHDYDIGDVGLPPSYAPPRRQFISQIAAVNGRFYFADTGKLGVLEFTPSPEFSYLDYPHIEFPEGSNFAKSFLVASHGELFDVYVFFKGFTPEILAVRVCAIDLGGAGDERPAFREVGDLGDRALLLGDANAALLCSASAHGVKGNRVYFMHNILEEPDGGPLRVYDLGDGSMETVRPCPGVSELMCKPFWVMPSAP
ncbi:hypothetical protein OsJ_04331 [Oryza sativa Japonica Group]|uniref:KIB1-4 beta-propeller domain-containing protein n=1 Tax=Oryza sativa subsp. japonica TaxID=39947 RepID=B9EUZ7_ORYSJ|nr:hypothetical protein OsJ_04331 [Oryza sativa Japonica Group]